MVSSRRAEEPSIGVVGPEAGVAAGSWSVRRCRVIAVLLCAAAGAAPVGLDRVDLISEDPGTWLHYDLPMAPYNVLGVTVGFVQQLKMVLRLGVLDESLHLGFSMVSQSIVLERPLPLPNLYWSGGVQTSLLLPRGLLAGVAWRPGRIRIGAGVSLLSSATWRRPDWTSWHVLPTVGFGLGRPRRSQ